MNSIKTAKIFFKAGEPIRSAAYVPRAAKATPITIAGIIFFHSISLFLV